MFGWLRRRNEPLRSSPDPWALDTPLLEWAKGVPWTIRDSFQGTQIFGATGSGKSSGSLPLVSTSFLRAGYGGVFFTVKPEDRRTYEGHIAEAGRSRDLVVVSPDRTVRFNIIASEIEQSPGAVGLAENITALILTAAELGDRASGGKQGSGGSENAEYFRKASVKLCRHAVFVLVLSGQPVTVPNLYRLLISTPRSRAEAKDPEWQKNSFFFACMISATEAPTDESQDADLELAAIFFMEEWSELNARTRTTVESTLTAATDALSRGLARDLLSAPEPNFSPAMLESGSLVIVDLPVLVYRDVGALVQVVLKYCIQRALSRRDVTKSPRPVFMVCDESHHLLVDSDPTFLTTARSTRTAVVLATQSISNYADLFGSQQDAKVHAMLGNMQTQLHHQQTDIRTIRYLQVLVGRSRQFLMSANSAPGEDWIATLMGQGIGVSAGMGEHFEFELQAGDLNSLAKGGPPRWCTEAIVYQGGRRFPGDRTWMKAVIPQHRAQTRQ